MQPRVAAPTTTAPLAPAPSPTALGAIGANGSTSSLMAGTTTSAARGAAAAAAGAAAAARAVPIAPGMRIHAPAGAGSVHAPAEGRIERTRTTRKRGSHGGRQFGQKNYTAAELEKLMDIVEQVAPVTATLWTAVWEDYSKWAVANSYLPREAAMIKQKFDRLANSTDPNCPPLVARAKRIASTILRRTHTGDDPIPAPVAPPPTQPTQVPVHIQTPPAQAVAIAPAPAPTPATSAQAAVAAVAASASAVAASASAALGSVAESGAGPFDEAGAFDEMRGVEGDPREREKAVMVRVIGAVANLSETLNRASRILENS